MLVYQVTVTIQHQREDEWRTWMQREHIQDVLDTGYFTSATMHKQQQPPPPDGSTTYCISYLCPSQRELDAYLTEAAPALQQDHISRFEGDFTASRVIMETLCSLP